LPAQAHCRTEPAIGPRPNTKPSEHLGELTRLREQLSVALG
jgi:hypothetical protein